MRYPKILLLLAVPAVLAGCAAKVAPWERGALARSQMALDPDVQDSALKRHTSGSKEGASGGYGVGGGGCGCN